MIELAKSFDHLGFVLTADVGSAASPTMVKALSRLSRLLMLKIATAREPNIQSHGFLSPSSAPVRIKKQPSGLQCTRTPLLRGRLQVSSPQAQQSSHHFNAAAHWVHTFAETIGSTLSQRLQVTGSWAAGSALASPKPDELKAVDGEHGLDGRRLSFKPPLHYYS
jgi:hypothetical protein